MAKAKAPASASATFVAKPKIDRHARNKKRMEIKRANPPKVPRGTARAKRREAAARAGIMGLEFKEVWAKFRELEKPQVTA